MDKENLDNFITSIKEAMYKAGEMALEFQGRVVNLRKETEIFDSDNDFIKQERDAKTIIDEKVQESLLLACLKLLDVSKIYLDVEEDTPSKKYFSKEPAFTTLVIDPIDGTLRYLLGKDSFSICVGLIEKGDVITALVYFPSRKDFYFVKDDSAYYEVSGKAEKLTSPKNKNNKKVYMNNRASSQVADRLVKQGFEITDDKDGLIAWPDALIGCIKGEYTACVFHTPQIRDVLMGAIISKINNGYACDWAGNKLVWPSKGRIPQVMFGFDPLPKNLLECL